LHPVDYVLILRITAALRAALCGLPVGTPHISPSISNTTSQALTTNPAGKGKAASSSAAVTRSTGAAQQSQDLEHQKAWRLEAAELAWAAFMASANSVHIVCTYWQKQRQDGGYGR
jgi:hypothetical protein